MTYAVVHAIEQHRWVSRTIRTARPTLPLKHDESILFLPARLVAGEQAAYRDCYQLYAPKLMRLLVNILRNKARAEEVLQDAFVAAFRGIGRFRGEVSICSWLTRIATNRAYNLIRDESRQKRTAPPSSEEAVSNLESQVEGRDLARKVIGLLDQMDPAKKLALLLQAEVWLM